MCSTEYADFIAHLDTLHVESHALEQYKSIPQQNLPTTNSPFFGRRNHLRDLKEYILSNSAQVININGPPAFGKSRLAIELGHDLRKHHTDHIRTIRYVDTETTRNTWYLCSPILGTKQNKEHTLTSQLHALSHRLPNRAAAYDSRDELSTLCDWSSSLKERTVLILDNCDHILRSNKRERFLDVIQMHFSNSMISLIITSQEKLFFLDDNFVSVSLSELSPSDSRAMLQHYAVNLTTTEADELASAVGHCPLALNIAAKLLLERGVGHLNALLEELKERVVDTISAKPTRNKEKFRVIMDIAYKLMDTQTQKCTRFLSLFQGAIASDIEKQIIDSFTNSSCIKDVIRISFIDEVFVNGKPRHKMHKLIRDYFKSVYPMNSDSRKQYVFNTSFINHYSDYLIGMMKQLYNNAFLTDEQFYTFVHLETHNLEQFENIVLFTTKNDKLKVKSSIALGLLIQENITNTFVVHQETLLETYSSYKNVSVFASLCKISSSKVCAQILWRIITNLSLPECISHNVKLTNYFNFLYQLISPSLTWFDDDTFCSSLYKCANMEAFQYEDTLQKIFVYNLNTHDEELLYDIVKQGVTLCTIHNYYYTRLLIGTIISLYWIWHSEEPRTKLLVQFTAYFLLLTVALYIITPAIIDEVTKYVFSSDLIGQHFDCLKSNFSCNDIPPLVMDLCSYKDYEYVGSISKMIFLAILFFHVLPMIFEHFFVELTVLLYCFLISLRLVSLSTCNQTIVSMIFFLISFVHRTIVFYTPLYFLRPSNSLTYPKIFIKACFPAFVRFVFALLGLIVIIYFFNFVIQTLYLFIGSIQGSIPETNVVTSSFSL